MSNRAVALGFVRSFCSGDIEGVEATIAEDFELRGPLFEFNSKSSYIESLRSGGLEPGECDVLGVSEDGDTVAIFYTYNKASGRMTVAQFFWFANQRIVKTLLVFDPKNL